MPDTNIADDLDRRILAALQLNGRASWNTVGRALEVSETTVARRAQRMVDAGLLRVVGVVDVLRCGFGVPVLTRIGTDPAAVDDVAAVVSARTDARFVTIVTGGCDVVSEHVVPSRRATHQLLARELPAIPGVREVASGTVLRSFAAAHDWNPGLLDAAAERLLRPKLPPPFESGASFAEPAQLDQMDLSLIAELIDDGRRTYKQLAATLGVNETTIARRVDSLVDRGCVRFRTLAEPTLLGFDLEVMVWLTVPPSKLEAVGTALATHPSVKYLVATSGEFQLAGRVALANHEDLYRFTASGLGGIDAITTAVVTPELETLKRSWVLTSEAIRSAAESVPAGGRPQHRTQGADASAAAGSTPAVVSTSATTPEEIP